ncbi:MAG TPA: hemolysin III family protein [Meiothermus sp.]|nr:hemolysin III family protein [Meiothermus sp.]
MIREPFNTYSHLTGAVLALVGTIVLALLSGGDAAKLAGALVFGVSMTVMYASSSLYHALKVSEKALQGLRRLDHAAIFLFIAGTYTPVVLQGLEPSWKPWALGIVWGLAVFGVFFRVFVLKAPRWLYTLSYVGLGWLVVFFWPKLNLNIWALVWLVAGGLAYSLGAINYATKWPDPWPKVVGFHGIWHLFVLAGSIFMYLAVLALYLK